MPSTSLEWMVQDGQRLQDCRHDHPFAVLGPQPHGDGWVVRAWLPEASQVDLLLDGRALPMATPHHPWVFEVELSEDPGQRYEYHVQRGGIEHRQHDPWAFREEWMGELDRHLFAEGNHHHIWRRLGAHPCERDNIAGVQFALWAPNARSVALLGECNNWDGRHHPMQLRIGGIWELFVPGLRPGALYKYEVRSPEGHCYQKADPYGF